MMLTANIKPIRNNVCMVTGATAGFGKAIALRLAKVGVRVILVGRNMERCTQTAKEIRRASENPNVDFFVCDLASFDEIRIMTKHFKTHFERLDVLVNNAAAMFPVRTESETGLELTVTINHLGPFLLTMRLLDALRTGRAAHIINITCDAAVDANPDLGDLHFTSRSYNGYKAYAQTKLFNLLFTTELAKRLASTAVAVSAVNPGVLNTELGLDTGWYGVLKRFRNATKGTDPQDAAEAITGLLSSEGASHLYYQGQTAAHLPEIATDETLQRNLWALSEDITGANETVILNR